MKIDIAVSDYFEGIFRVFGWILVPAGIYAFTQNAVIGAIIALIVILVFTTKYRLFIDLNEKVYKEYLWILGFANGQEYPFEKLGSVFVKPENYLQRINSFVHTKEIRFTVYAVYVIADGQDLFSGEFKDPVKANERARELAKKLNTGSYLV